MSLIGQTPGASTSAPFSKDRLSDALDVVNGVGKIHLPLSEEQARQSLASLQCRDQASVEQLLLICHDMDFHFFLAALELEVTREMDDEPENQYPSLYFEDDPDTIGFCINSTLKAECVNDLNGSEVLSSITIDEEEDHYA
ncbi:hypothetical protein F4782DRAFT_526065 [Xylaria castorea]|nr:hypothetical protein F4782DRAFT_526065 [Xylaria castorea]